MTKEKRLVPELRFPGFDGEWEESSLGRVSYKLKYGLNSAATEYDGFNGYIRITDINDSGKFIKENTVSPSGDFDDEYLLKEGDILLARTGASVGKTYLYKNSDGKLYFAGFLIKATVKEDSVSEFIYYQTKINRYNKWVQVMSMRSGQPGINALEYSKYTIFLASKKEQQKIATFLSLIDKKIELLEKKVELLEEQKRGLLQQIFSQEIRFKKEDGSEFEEWIEEELGNSMVLNRTRNKDLDITNILSVSNDRGFILQRDLFKKGRIASDDLKNYIIVKEDDFAFNPARINVGSIARLKQYKSGVISPMYTCFKLKKNIDNEFFEQYLVSSKFKKLLNRVLVGSVRQVLQTEELMNLRLLLPAIREQQRISKFLSVHDIFTEKTRRKLEYIRTCKKGLLQKLFV